MVDNMWIHRFVWYGFVSKIFQRAVEVSHESITEEENINQRVKFSGQSVNLWEQNLVLPFLPSVLCKKSRHGAHEAMSKNLHKD